jgi:hypothetical protein
MEITSTRELKEILQENIITYLDGHSNEILDAVCKIIIEAVNNYETNKQ